MRIIFLTLLILLSSTSWAQLKIKIGIYPLMPYLGQKQNGEWEGFLADIFSAVGKTSHIKFQFIETPLPRLVQSLQKKEVDFIVIPGSQVRYLPDVSITSTAVGVNFAGALTTLPEDEVIIDFEDLLGRSVLLTYMGPETEPLRVGIMAKTEGAKKTELVEISGSDIAERMMLMMNNQRAQIALGDYAILRYSLLQAKNKNIRLVPTSLSGFNPIVFTSWKGQKDFQLVDRQMKTWFKRARKRGELQKMLKKYNLEDWQYFLSH